MIKILIAEDDVFYRTTFLSFINWEDINCKICYQADNGQQAIQIMRSNAVDVVITDMNMPELNGVELIRYIKENHPNIKCLALSSYDDFIYVKESMKYGAIDYILKHTLTKEILIQHMKSISAQPSINANFTNQPIKQKRVSNKILCDLIKNSFDIPQNITYKQLLIDCNIHLPKPPFTIFLIQLEDLLTLRSRYSTKEQFRKFIVMTINIIQNTYEGYGEVYCFKDNDELIYSILGNKRFSSKLYLYNTIQSVSKQVKSNLKRFLNIDAAISASGLCLKYEDLHKGYALALERLHNNSDSDHDELEETIQQSVIPSIDVETEQLITERFNSINFETLKNLIEQEFKKYRNEFCSRQTFQHLSVEFISILNRICKSVGLSHVFLYNDSISPYAQIGKITSYTKMVEFVLIQYNECHKLMHSNHSLDNKIVQNAIYYIKSNYSNDISLTATAEHVNCNAAYLSRIFKKEIGIGFIEYLTDYRLELALELLKTNKSVKEVSYSVGFPNYNYFFKVFKNKMGMTPQSYINNEKIGLGRY